MSADFGKQFLVSQSYAQSSVSPGGNAADISCRAISDGMKCIVNKRYEFVNQIVFIDGVKQITVESGETFPREMSF